VSDVFDAVVRPVLEKLGPDGLTAAAAALDAESAARGIVVAGWADGRQTARAVPVDPVPSVVDPVEWAALTVGVAQRHRALNEFLADVYRAAGRRRGDADQEELVRVMQRLYAANGVDTDLERALFEADHGSPAEALSLARAEWRRRASIHVADALAWALHVNGKDEEALVQARQATGTGYRNPVFRYHLGMIEKSLGSVEPARRHLREALAVNPHFSPVDAPLARRALTELDSPSC